MSAPATARLRRCRDELVAARAMLDAGLPSRGISHAFLAAFHAASAALLELGEMPATRPGVVSAFARRLVLERDFDHEVARVLRRLYEDHADVDYGLAEAPPEIAQAAVADAERFVDAVEQWLASR
jgi:uncharacterized protein (UPF0332 family)